MPSLGLLMGVSSLRRNAFREGPKRTRKRERAKDAKGNEYLMKNRGKLGPRASFATFGLSRFRSFAFSSVFAMPRRPQSVGRPAHHNTRRGMRPVSLSGALGAGCVGWRGRSAVAVAGRW